MVKFALAVGMIFSALAFSGSIVIAADAILIDFSSAHCAHCRAMEPTLSQLERSGVPVRHVNVAAEPELARRFGIRQTPTYVVVSGGKEVTRLVGTHTLSELRGAIAIDPSGPLIPTGAKSRQPAAPAPARRSLAEIPGPQTRLAPIASKAMAEQTFTSSAAASLAPPNRLAPSRETAAPSSEAMPSLSRADAVERAKAATVRLRVHDGHGYGAGTGTIIDTHGEEALVLTCGHLFRETKGEGKIEVDLFVGGQTQTVLGQVIDYDADTRDIALVAIRPGFPVQAVEINASDESIRNGQTAFSFGCDRGDDPSRRDTRITGINKYNQHLGVSNLEIAGAPIDGRSGGGLFDDRGRLIGVCNAADYKGDVGIYAGPGTVQWQLDRVDLAHLYQQPAAASGPLDRIAGVPDDSAAIVPVSATAPAQLAPQVQSAASTQEVIVIVRDRNRPESTSRVMTLDNPSDDLMQMIQRQSR